MLAAEQATSTIPIIFAVAVDPVGGGLVAIVARPGGNVAGFSLQFSDLAGQRLEFLREVVPTISGWGFWRYQLSRGRFGASRGRGCSQGAWSANRQNGHPACAGYRTRVRHGQSPRSSHLYLCRRTRSHQPDSHQHSRGWSATSNPARQSEYVEAGGLISYGPTFRTHFGAPPTMWTKYCAAQSRPNSRRATD